MLKGKTLIACEPVDAGDGHFTAGGGMTEFEEASVAHVDRAVDAAESAFHAYRRVPSDMRADFLEVGRFPTIEFHVSDLMTPSSTSNPANWDVVLQGKLTVHGVTREVNVPTSVTLAADRITARGQIYLDMRDFNIRVPRLLLIPMRSEVLVGFEVVAHPVR